MHISVQMTIYIIIDFVMLISVQMNIHILLGFRHAHLCTNYYPYYYQYNFMISSCTYLYE